MFIKQYIMRIASIAATVVYFGGAAFAQGVPVNDAQSILKEIETYQHLLEDFDVQTEQLTQLQDQLAKLQEQYEKLEEIRGLLEDPSQILDMVIDPRLSGILEGDFNTADIVGAISAGAKGDWSGIINDSTGGGLLDRINKSLESAGTSQEEVTTLSGSENPEAQRNAQVTASNAVTSAAAEVAYQEAGELVERTQLLVDEIPGLSGLKESVDHNTRVTAELAIALAAIWQLEAVQTVNVGLTGVADAATLAEVQKFYDFTAPEIE